MTDFTLDGITLSVPKTMLNDRIAGKLTGGGYEANEARAAQMRIKAGQRVVELGAGLGFVTSVCARATGAKNVVSVEANPAMLPVVSANLAQNGFGDVTLLHGAITGAGTEDAIAFDRKKAFWAGRIADETSDASALVQVPRLALPDVLLEYRPDVVIMDVEGAEQYLFDDPWPNHVVSVVLELHPKQYPNTVIKRIVDCMSDSGLTYDPGPSRGQILCFRRVRDR